MSVSFFMTSKTHHVAHFRKSHQSGSSLQAVTHITKRHHQGQAVRISLHKPNYSHQRLPSFTFHMNEGTTSCFRGASSIAKHHLESDKTLPAQTL